MRGVHRGMVVVSDWRFVCIILDVKIFFFVLVVVLRAGTPALLPSGVDEPSAVSC